MGPTETNRLQQKPLETNRIFLMVSIGLYGILDLGGSKLYKYVSFINSNCD